jgi:hypothetical protein
MKITIACLYNKPEVFKECILDSYNQLNHKDVKLFPIYNDHNVYSASAAYNIVFDVTKSDVVIFAHQDIRFDQDLINRLRVLIEQLGKNWAVIGVAGRIPKISGKISNVSKCHDQLLGEVKDDTGIAWPGKTGIHYVDVVDECFFVVNKPLNFNFDYGFNRFHFYGSDICLQARAAQYDVVVADLPIVHVGKYSHSMTDKTYFKQLRYLNDKWYALFREVNATHFSWKDRKISSHIPFTIDSKTHHKMQVLNIRCEYPERR